MRSGRQAAPRIPAPSLTRCPNVTSTILVTNRFYLGLPPSVSARLSLLPLPPRPRPRDCSTAQAEPSRRAHVESPCSQGTSREAYTTDQSIYYTTIIIPRTRPSPGRPAPFDAAPPPLPRTPHVATHMGDRPTCSPPLFSQLSLPKRCPPAGCEMCRWVRILRFAPPRFDARFP